MTTGPAGGFESTYKRMPIAKSDFSLHRTSIAGLAPSRTSGKEVTAWCVDRDSRQKETRLAIHHC